MGKIKVLNNTNRHKRNKYADIFLESLGSELERIPNIMNAPEAVSANVFACVMGDRIDVSDADQMVEFCGWYSKKYGERKELTECIYNKWENGPYIFNFVNDLLHRSYIISIEKQFREADRDMRIAVCKLYNRIASMGCECILNFFLIEDVKECHLSGMKDEDEKELAYVKACIMDAVMSGTALLMIGKITPDKCNLIGYGFENHEIRCFSGEDLRKTFATLPYHDKNVDKNVVYETATL